MLPPTPPPPHRDHFKQALLRPETSFLLNRKKREANYRGSTVTSATPPCICNWPPPSQKRQIPALGSESHPTTTPVPLFSQTTPHPPAGAFLLPPQGALLLSFSQPPSSLVLLFTAECLERGFYKDYRCFLSPSLPRHLLRHLCPLAVNAWRAGPATPGLSIISCRTRGTHCFSSAHEHPSASSLHPTGFSQQPGMAGARVIRNDFPGRDF